MIVITEELLESLKTENGGYTKKDLEVLGISWPPIKGWKKDLIGELIDEKDMKNDLWKPPKDMISNIYYHPSAKGKKKKDKTKSKKLKHAEEDRKFLIHHFGLQKYATNHAVCFVVCKKLEWEMPGNKNQYRKTIKKAAKALRYKERPKKVGKSRFKNSEEFYKSKAWKELRFIALTNCGGACQLCGAMAKDGVKIHADHIKPRSRYPGLELDLDNIQVFCEDCNIGKSNYDDTDWKQHWESI